MVVPARTAEQRRAASTRAVLARRRRAEVGAALKAGDIGLIAVLELAEQDEAVAGMRVSAVLESLPRVGPRRSADAMIRLRISPTRRLRGLGSTQRAALLALTSAGTDAPDPPGPPVTGGPPGPTGPTGEPDPTDRPPPSAARHNGPTSSAPTPGARPAPSAHRSPGPTSDARARLTVLSGPSGVGKGTVVAAVRRRHPTIWVSVSVTTRRPRPGEVDGVHYRFVSSAEYDRMAARGELLEHATFAGNGYGTPRGPVEERIAAGLPTLLEIELQGARQIRSHDPRAQLVFLLPPSWAELEHRLRGRGTETESVVAARLDRARLEMEAVGEFDEQIVNDDVERAAAELVSLVQSVCSPPVPAGPNTDLDSDHHSFGR